MPVIAGTPFRKGDIVIYDGSMTEYTNVVFRVVDTPTDNNDRGYTIVPASKAINDAVNRRLWQYDDCPNELRFVSRQSLVGLFDLSKSYLHIRFGM